MKKNLIALAALAFPLLAVAQAVVTPTPDNMVWKKNIQPLKLSASGEWVGSGAGDASVYNLVTGEYIDYWGGTLGLGNPVANNGWAVGQTASSYGVMMTNGSIKTPATLSPYWFSTIDGITPDASRVCGFVSNPDAKGYYMQYIPFVADLDANGEMGEPQILPYPDKFFFGDTPNRVTAIWISDDGKTVLGEIVSIIDALGAPIVFTQDDNGKWSYSLPSEKLFNPNGIVMPEDPEEMMGPAPEPTDFMSPLQLAAYQKAFQDYVNSNYDLNLYPEPEKYMTEEEIEAYNEAANEYNAWLESDEFKQAEMAYKKAYTEIRQSSPFFNQNEMALCYDGSCMIQSGSMINNQLQPVEYIYKFMLDGSDEYARYESPASNSYPSVILPDGTAFVVQGIDPQIIPSSYVLEPGKTTYTPFAEYIAPEYPEVAEWIELNFPTACGVVQTNEDMTVFASALYYMNYMTWSGDEDFFYSGYFFSNTITFAGIESIVAENQDGVYRVYNLQGVKVLETKDASQLNNLPKGIYVINGKKIAI